MTKKVIAFDLDDTLAITKSPINDRMAELLTQLLERYEVCVISGGKYEQFKMQIIDQLEASHLLLLQNFTSCQLVAPGTIVTMTSKKSGSYNIPRI